MACVECENHERWVFDAEQAILGVQKKVKNLASLTFSEVKQIDTEFHEIRQRLISSKSSRTRHRNKCLDYLAKHEAP